MSLRTKAIHIILAIIVLTAGFQYGIVEYLIYPGFENLEHKNAERDISRCKEALQRETAHLSAMCHDWAAWDAMWEFAGGHYPDFIHENLPPTTFSDMSVDLIIICDTAGDVVWGEIHDPDNDTAVSMPEVPATSLGRRHPLFDLPYADQPLSEVALSGLYLTSAGPMLVSSRPILKNMNKGPVRGVFLTGRFLTDAYLRTLVEQTRVDLRWWAVSDTGISPDGRTALAAMNTDTAIHLNPRDNDILESYAVLADIERKPALLLRADIPRTITAEGRATSGFALVSGLISAVVVFFVLLLLLQKLIVGPVIILTHHVVRIRTSADLSQRINPTTSDELGTLGREFDQMVGELATARNRLAEQSYHTGRAEMAATTLHHIRNALTPVMCQVDDMNIGASRIPVNDLEQALRELSDDTVPDNRRVALTEFVCTAADTVVPFVRAIAQETESLSASIQRIEQVLGQWDETSHGDRTVEPVSVRRIVAEAVNGVARGTPPHISIQIGPLNHLPNIVTDQNVIVHVLTEIMRRAAGSIDRIGDRDGCIEISGATDSKGGREHVILTIADNGAGLSTQMLEHVFDRDSLESGDLNPEHSPHWCANELTAMGGKMWITSAGPGLGTAAYVCVPTADVPAHPIVEPTNDLTTGAER